MVSFRRCAYLVSLLLLASVSEARRKLKRDHMESLKSLETVDFDEDFDELEPCQCGVFLSQQVGIKEGRRGRPRGPPQGEPVVTYDTDSPSLPCGAGGFKHCISKCLDVILKYLPRAGPVICGAVERDVRREKAFLFIRNCGGQWTPTNFSAGKEFCCTDGEHHKCLSVGTESTTGSECFSDREEASKKLGGCQNNKSHAMMQLHLVRDSKAQQPRVLLEITRSFCYDQQAIENQYGDTRGMKLRPCKTYKEWDYRYPV